MPKQLGRDEQEAITNLQNQIEALAQIRANAEQAHVDSPHFIGWKSHTTDLMRHYISAKSEHLSRFRMLSFRSNVMQLDWPGARYHSGPRRDDIEKFASDADVAVACLQGAIEHIKVFGLKQEEPAAPAKPVRSREARGLTQHFHGPVNQAVATDNARQRVGHIGPSGNSLDEIVRLLRESEELTPRQVKEAAGVAEQLNAEVQKEKGTRNWKAIAEWGATLLTITEKATDLSAKLGPHLPTIAALIEEAKRYF